MRKCGTPHLSPDNSPLKRDKQNLQVPSALTHIHTNRFLFRQSETNQLPPLIRHLIHLAASCCDGWPSSQSRPKQIELLFSQGNKANTDWTTVLHQGRNLCPSSVAAISRRNKPGSQSAASPEHLRCDNIVLVCPRA